MVVLAVFQVKQAVIWALQAGYRHIDCAAIYGNEVEIGEALQETLGPDKVSQHQGCVPDGTLVPNLVHYFRPEP